MNMQRWIQRSIPFATVAVLGAAPMALAHWRQVSVDQVFGTGMLSRKVRGPGTQLAKVVWILAGITVNRRMCQIDKRECRSNGEHRGKTFPIPHIEPPWQ